MIRVAGAGGKVTATAAILHATAGSPRGRPPAGSPDLGNRLRVVPRPAAIHDPPILPEAVGADVVLGKRVEPHRPPLLVADRPGIEPVGPTERCAAAGQNSRGDEQRDRRGQARGGNGHGGGSGAGWGARDSRSLPWNSPRGIFSRFSSRPGIPVPSCLKPSLPWVGVARAISPDAPFRHPAFRSLDENRPSPSWLRTVSNAVEIARATPPATRT